jgi:hypothetical protein
MTKNELKDIIQECLQEVTSGDDWGSNAELLADLKETLEKEVINPIAILLVRDRLTRRMRSPDYVKRASEKHSLWLSNPNTLKDEDQDYPGLLATIEVAHKDARKLVMPIYQAISQFRS